MVAVVALSLWQFLATVPVFGRILHAAGSFFLPTRSDVGSQIQMVHVRRDLVHLMITLWDRCCFRDRLRSAACWSVFWFARQPRVAAVFDIRQDGQRAAARVLAPIFTLWLGPRHLVQGRARRNRWCFHCSQRSIRGSRKSAQTVLDNGRMLGMSERQLTRHVYWPSAAVVDVFSLQHLGRLLPGVGPVSAISPDLREPRAT